MTHLSLRGHSRSLLQPAEHRALEETEDTNIYHDTHVLYMQCKGCPPVGEDRHTQHGGCSPCRLLESRTAPERRGLGISLLYMRGEGDIPDLTHIQAWVLEIIIRSVGSDILVLKLTFSNWCANLVRVAFIARGTDASCPVVVDLTDGVNPTFIVVNTGIFALLADTCKCSGTVAVYGAFRLALHIGISLEPRRTGADTSVS